MGKANPFVGKADASIKKVVVLLLKHSLPSSDEELFGPCPMVEETQDTQDPDVTIGGANS